MTLEFIITTIAIILGPLGAVLVTSHLQSKQDQKGRRLYVFRALMTSRKTPLSPQRVEALNLVEIEFHGEKKVIEKFKDLLNVYNDHGKWKSQNHDIVSKVIQEVDDKTAELLNAMASTLGYKFEALELLRGGYNPEAFLNLDRQQADIREFLVGLNNGSKAVPIALLDVRHPEKLLEQARNAQLLLEDAQKTEAKK